jgi:hypothetical protein
MSQTAPAAAAWLAVVVPAVAAGAGHAAVAVVALLLHPHPHCCLAAVHGQALLQQAKASQAHLLLHLVYHLLAALVDVTVVAAGVSTTLAALLKDVGVGGTAAAATDAQGRESHQQQPCHALLLLLPAAAAAVGVQVHARRYEVAEVVAAGGPTHVFVPPEALTPRCS